jgi:hypothetical protein
MKKLETIEDIKSAVDEGKTVFSDTRDYSVVKNRSEYYIVCSINGYTIGLHGMAGTKYECQLNGTKFWHD